VRLAPSKDTQPTPCAREAQAPDARRRALAFGGLQLVLAGSLLRHASRADATTGALRGSALAWLRQLDQVSAGLAAGAVAPLAWQEEVEHVLGRLDTPDLLRAIDFPRLAANAKFPSQGEGMERLYFLDDDGRLQPLAFRPFLFTLHRGAAVVPHGHHNMATLHLVLEGEARVRHFDRLASTATHMDLRLVGDATARPGQVSSVSDERHNVHWFESLSERVFMFNVGVYQVTPGAPFGERDYVDPRGGMAIGGGVIRAPRLDRAAAYAKYGRS
jgi:hypothetical protein